MIIDSSNDYLIVWITLFVLISHSVLVFSIKIETQVVLLNLFIAILYNMMWIMFFAISVFAAVTQFLVRLKRYKDKVLLDIWSVLSSSLLPRGFSTPTCFSNFQFKIDLFQAKSLHHLFFLCVLLYQSSCNITKLLLFSNEISQPGHSNYIPRSLRTESRDYFTLMPTL